MYKKNKLLNNLKYDIYVRLAPSKLHGVGVVAIKDIPKGTNPFKLANKSRYNSIKCTKADLKNVNPAVKKND